MVGCWMVQYTPRYTEVNSMTEQRNGLAKHLLAIAGTLGRATPEIQRIAKKSKLSVHTVQSLAMGRKKLLPSNMIKLRKALGSDFQF